MDAEVFGASRDPSFFFEKLLAARKPIVIQRRLHCGNADAETRAAKRTPADSVVDDNVLCFLCYIYSLLYDVFLSICPANGLFRDIYIIDLYDCSFTCLLSFTLPLSRVWVESNVLTLLIYKPPKLGP